MFRRLSHTLGHLRHHGDLESGPIPELDLEEIACLERDLEDLGSLVVPPAARERGWAVVMPTVALDRTSVGSQPSGLLGVTVVAADAVSAPSAMTSKARHRATTTVRRFRVDR